MTQLSGSLEYWTLTPEMISKHDIKEMSTSADRETRRIFRCTRVLLKFHFSEKKTRAKTAISIRCLRCIEEEKYVTKNEVTQIVICITIRGRATRGIVFHFYT